MRFPAPLLLGLALAAAPVPAAHAQSPPELRAVLANGYRFAYQAAGEGPALLLVHDALDDYRAWDETAAALADRHRVVAFSRRYHFPNPSRPDDPPYSFETSATDLLAIIRALGLNRPVVAGRGWGATVALLAALREPSLLGGLVLIEPWADSLIEPSELRRQLAGDRSRRFAEAAARTTSRDPESGPREFTEAMDGMGSWAHLAPGEQQRRRDNGATALLTAAPGPVLRCPEVAALNLPLALLTPERGSPIRAATGEALTRCLASGRGTRHIERVPSAPGGLVTALRNALASF